MTELSEKQKALHDARQQFMRAAEVTTKSLTKQRQRLLRDAKRTGARAARAGDQLQKKVERLAKSTQTKTKREIRSQIKKLEKVRDTALEDTKEMRSELALVGQDLASARKHLTHALHIDKAMARVEKELAKRFGAKPTRKTSVRKKAGKKASAKASATRKAPAKKAPGKKTPAKKAPAKKTAVRKSVSAKRKKS